MYIQESSFIQAGGLLAGTEYWASPDDRYNTSELPGNSSVYFNKCMRFNLRVMTAASGEQLNQRKRKGISLTWHRERPPVHGFSGSHWVTFMPASVSRWNRCVRRSLTVSSRCGQPLVNNGEAVIFAAGPFTDEWLIRLQMAKSHINTGVTTSFLGFAFTSFLEQESVRTNSFDWFNKMWWCTHVSVI